MTYYAVERKDHQGKVVEVRLVQAPTAVRALTHVAAPSFNVKKPTQEELVELLLQGRKPETVEAVRRGRPRKMRAVA